MKKENKGITLIALVITIIVMLILVAVTISMAINGGLFNYAGKAAGDTKNAIEEEQVLANGQVEVEGKKYDSIQDYLDGKEHIPTYEEAEKDANGYLKANTPFVDGKQTAIIPAGFKVIEGVNGDQSIENGLVVEAKDGNQFVWIPINTTEVKHGVATYSNINDMFICQAKTETDGTCDIRLGTDGEPYCEAHKVDSEKSKKMAGKLYATGMDTNLSFTADGKLVEGMKKYTANSSLREPDVVSAYDTGKVTITELQTDYNKYVKSVIKNGGFYVGRYETGGIPTTDTYTEGSIKIKPVANTVPSRSITWYLMYDHQKKYIEEELKQIGGMINGAAYDQVMRFVHDPENNFDVTKSNYTHSGPYASGDKDEDESKNIYDLEGNLREWTTESSDAIYRVCRGGCYYLSRSPSYRDFGNPTNSSNYRYGSRVVLYVADPAT